jgi:alkaline phosphatase
MMRSLKRIALASIAMVMLAAGCGASKAEAPQTRQIATQAPIQQTATQAPPVQQAATQPEAPSAQAPVAQEQIEKAKYVFLFIGDGMGYPQINTAEILAKQIVSPGTIGVERMEFTQFENAGSVTTYDAESFCPDSASTGTAMASGNKTLGGVINMDVTKTEKFTIISELAKSAGYKVGVISSVSLDHATPACFYAKQASRGDYYDIGLQLVNSQFDFFGGGGFLQPTGKDGDKEDLVELAMSNGFTVPVTNDEILALDGDSGRVLAISPVLADAKSLPYELDRLKSDVGSLSLAQFVQKGIDVLDNENGFFLMTEGGKVDWACHANDAASAMFDTLALNDAVQVAVDFASNHPGDTLILVTGDHETGGLTIGFAATGYSTFFEKTLSQNMSFIQFDETYVKNMRESGATFEDAMAEITKVFGLEPPASADGANAGMALTEGEYKKLQEAYALSIIPSSDRNYDENQSILYGAYEPLSVTCTHILNNKAGIGWTSYAHTGVPIPVFAYGAKAGIFGGSYDNTDIFRKLSEVMELGQSA